MTAPEDHAQSAGEWTADAASPTETPEPDIETELQSQVGMEQRQGGM